MIQLQIIHSIPIVLPVFCTKAIRSIGKAKLWCLSTLFTALLLACSLAIRKDHAKALRAWPADANPLDLFGGVEKTKLSRRRWHDHTLYLQWWILKGKSSLVSGFWCPNSTQPRSHLRSVRCESMAGAAGTCLRSVSWTAQFRCPQSSSHFGFPYGPIALFCLHQNNKHLGGWLVRVLAKVNVRFMPVMPWQVESSCCW